MSVKVEFESDSHLTEVVEALAKIRIQRITINAVDYSSDVMKPESTTKESE